MIITKPLTLLSHLAVFSSLGMVINAVQANTLIQEQLPPWEQAPQAAIPMTSLTHQYDEPVQQYLPATPTPATHKVNSAVNKTLQSAQQGHPRAQYDLALMYRNGRGVEADNEQFVYWLNQSAQGGEPDAEYMLSELYRDGTFGEVDMKRSLHWATESAKRGHVTAQHWLGTTYLQGNGVAVDRKQGLHWLQQAAQRGSKKAQLALHADKTRQQERQIATQQADTYPRPTAAPDYPPAAAPMPVNIKRRDASNNQNAVARQVQEQAEARTEGRTHLNGLNPNDVLELANTGDRYAQFLVGSLYEEGASGFTQSYREASRWYRRSARQSYPKAQYNLALLYEDGRGVEQDYKQAAQWYEQAALGGFVKAKNNLGILYVLGKGVTKSRHKAEQLFNQAAREGDKDAAYNLSRLVKS